MKNRSVLLLIALIIAIVYICLQIGNYSNSAKIVTADTETAEEAGAALGTAIGMAVLLPHLILVILGAIFNAVAWLGKFRWAALTAAILYTVGGVLGFVNIVFMIVPMILCYVAYAKSKPA